MDLITWRRKDSFRRALDFRYREKNCPVCGKLVQAKFYDERKKAWCYKHQRNLTKKFGKYKRESYYCEAKAVG